MFSNFPRIGKFGLCVGRSYIENLPKLLRQSINAFCLSSAIVCNLWPIIREVKSKLDLDLKPGLQKAFSTFHFYNRKNNAEFLPVISMALTRVSIASLQVVCKYFRHHYCSERISFINKKHSAIALLITFFVFSAGLRILLTIPLRSTRRVYLSEVFRFHTVFRLYNGQLLFFLIRIPRKHMWIFKLYCLC